MIEQMIVKKQAEVDVLNQLQDFLVVNEEEIYKVLLDYCHEVEQWPDAMPSVDNVISQVVIWDSIISVNLKEPVSRHWYANYEDIAHKVNEVGYGTSVLWDTFIEKPFKMGMYTVFVRVHGVVEATLPDEDVEMLTQLGKIHVDVPSGEVSKSIVCDGGL